MGIWSFLPSLFLPPLLPSFSHKYLSVPYSVPGSVLGTGALDKALALEEQSVGQANKNKKTSI